jgi:DNA-binding response OmpR family regulator
LMVDLMMPDIDGVSLIKDVRKTDHTTPIIVVTGSSNQKLIGAASASGANIILEKPMKVATLIEALKEVLPNLDYSQEA